MLNKAQQQLSIQIVSANTVSDLVRLDQRASRCPWNHRMFLAEFSNRFSTTYGAFEAGELLGHLVVHVVLDEAHIVHFAVEPIRRGEGIGRALLFCALSSFIASGLTEVFLEVRPSNLAAIKLYESEGFVRVGTRRQYYSDNLEDALIMRLALRASAGVANW